jgi:hypothetical protein
MQSHDCECGGKYKMKHRAEHNNSKKHKKYLEGNKTNIRQE